MRLEIHLQVRVDLQLESHILDHHLPGHRSDHNIVRPPYYTPQRYIVLRPQYHTEGHPRLPLQYASGSYIDFGLQLYITRDTGPDLERRIVRSLDDSPSLENHGSHRMGWEHNSRGMYGPKLQNHDRRSLPDIYASSGDPTHDSSHNVGFPQLDFPIRSDPSYSFSGVDKSPESAGRNDFPDAQVI